VSDNWLVSNDDMPERPSTHVVGSKAVRQFINALPDEWVAREPSEDYGIDVEVEVFKGGKATGLTFKVQSKARCARRCSAF